MTALRRIPPLPAAVCAMAVSLCLAAPVAAAHPADPVPADYARAVATAPLRLCGHDVVDSGLITAQLRGESGFDRLAASAAGAQGPAQLTPAAFAVYGADDDHNGVASPFDIGDAVSALVRADCALATHLLDRGHAADRESITAAYVGGLHSVDDPTVRAMAREVLR
ncbi:lytic transglycosylase domain-containing protein [Williamsia herbipolensis]|uniref:lytic transglycosylase domain-containing protein n=1 Tax=Williamsia herbipolensis TaxID=1603258 RepID=UPI000A49D99A|nr:lytic transglycosylase domain-containing protein [Williamsia herbipolensis]